SATTSPTTHSTYTLSHTTLFRSRTGDPRTVADTSDFKNGLVLKIDNQLQQIIEFQHVKPGKGPAFVRTKLKNVLSGKVVDKTFKDRKSTRLNSSHSQISYAVFCL